MAIIGDALRQAFMPKHEYECLREEDKAWVKLQRPFLISAVTFICLVIVVCTAVSLRIVFPADNIKRPFCGDLRLQPLPINVKGGGDSDLYPGAFYLTDQETVDYYWMVVFIPSTIIFLASAAYLVAGNIFLRTSLSLFMGIEMLSEFYGNLLIVVMIFSFSLASICFFSLLQITL